MVALERRITKLEAVYVRDPMAVLRRCFNDPPYAEHKQAIIRALRWRREYRFLVTDPANGEPGYYTVTWWAERNIPVTTICPVEWGLAFEEVRTGKTLLTEADLERMIKASRMKPSQPASASARERYEGATAAIEEETRRAREREELQRQVDAEYQTRIADALAELVADDIWTADIA